MPPSPRLLRSSSAGGWGAGPAASRFTFGRATTQRLFSDALKLATAGSERSSAAAAAVRPHPPAATTNRRNPRGASLAQGDDADADAGRGEEEVGEDDQEHDDNWLLEEILAEVLSADRVLRPAHDETQALVRANP